MADSLCSICGTVHESMTVCPVIQQWDRETEALCAQITWDPAEEAKAALEIAREECASLRHERDTARRELNLKTETCEFLRAELRAEIVRQAKVVDEWNANLPRLWRRIAEEIANGNVEAEEGKPSLMALLAAVPRADLVNVTAERDAARAEAAALKAEAETFELQVDQLSEQFQALLGDYEALRVQLGSATSSIDEAPDGTILFESEVPASFSKKYSECVRRVRVLANDRVSGGLMVFGMEGWHSEPDGSGGRDFTPEEIAQHRYGDMVGVWANQGERVCIRLLLDRVSALKAKLDDTEAAYAAVMDYDRILNESLSKALGVPDESRLIDEWEELFDAKIKGAVPREVAERGGEIAFSAGVGLGLGKADTRYAAEDIYINNWASMAATAAPRHPGGAPRIIAACLARAEAEHAKNGGKGT